MSIPSFVKHSGVAVSQDCSGGNFGIGPIDTSFGITCAAQKSGQDDVVNATSGSPLVLPLENVAKVRVLIIAVSGNSVTLQLTSAAGNNQAIPLSSGGMQIHFAPTVGDEFTAISIVGNGATVNYFIAGDLS
jgi:hypothetical protein